MAREEYRDFESQKSGSLQWSLLQILALKLTLKYSSFGTLERVKWIRSKKVSPLAGVPKMLLSFSLFLLSQRFNIYPGGWDTDLTKARLFLTFSWRFFFFFSMYTCQEHLWLSRLKYLNECSPDIRLVFYTEFFLSAILTYSMTQELLWGRQGILTAPSMLASWLLAFRSLIEITWLFPGKSILTSSWERSLGLISSLFKM